MTLIQGAFGVTLAEVPAVATDEWARTVIPNVRARRPRAFFARMDYWRSGAGSSWLSEFVSGSRELPLPIDGKTGRIKDRLDRNIREDSSEYAGAARTIEKALAVMAGLEEKWLFDIEQASKDQQDIAADGESCEGCGQTRSQFEFKKPKTAWGKRRGLAPCCYQTWLEWDRPDLLVFKARIKEVRG